MAIQIFRVYFITFRVEAEKWRKRENQGTRAQGIDLDGQGLLNQNMEGG